MLGGLTKLQHDSLRRMIAVDVTIAYGPLSTCSASWSSTAKQAPSCSPIWAGMRFAESAVWHSQATRYSSCGSRSPAWTARRCGDKW